MNAVATIARSIINIVYPLHCLICHKQLSAISEPGICDACNRQVIAHPRPYCRLCGRTLQGGGDLCGNCRSTKPAFAMARSACLYEGALKEAIHLFKYKGKKSLSGILARHMTDFLHTERELIAGVDIITFVPLHRKRFSARGFNQSQLLAKYISERSGVKVVDTLIKSSATRNQNELSRQERLRNLHGAFTPRAGARGQLAGASALLIDDVMTTGATLDECSRALLGMGAADVRCLTLARGM